MRGVRLPLPRQPHQIHRTVRDRDRAARPQSQALLAEWNESRSDEEGPCAQIAPHHDDWNVWSDQQ